MAAGEILPVADLFRLKPLNNWCLELIGAVRSPQGEYLLKNGETVQNRMLRGGDTDSAYWSYLENQEMGTNIGIRRIIRGGQAVNPGVHSYETLSPCGRPCFDFVEISPTWWAMVTADAPEVEGLQPLPKWWVSDSASSVKMHDVASGRMINVRQIQHIPFMIDPWEDYWGQQDLRVFRGMLYEWFRSLGAKVLYLGYAMDMESPGIDCVYRTQCSNIKDPSSALKGSNHQMVEAILRGEQYIPARQLRTRGGNHSPQSLFESTVPPRAGPLKSEPGDPAPTGVGLFGGDPDLVGDPALVVELGQWTA